MGEGELIKTQFSPLVISDLQLERKVDVDSLSRYRLAIRCQQQSLGWRGWYRRTQLVSFFLPMSVQFDGHKSPKDNNFAFARAVTCNDRTGLITVYLLLSFYFFFCVCDRRLDPARIDSRRTRTSFGRQKRVQQRRNKLGHGQIKKASIGGVCETHRTAELTQCDAQRRMTRNYPWTWIRKSLLFTFEIKGREEAQQQRQVRGDPVERLGDGRDAREKPIN